MVGGGGKKTPLAFYEEMICVILGRSGALQLDLSVRFHRLPSVSGVAHYSHIIAHLRRAHVLDMDFEGGAYFPLLTYTQELLNLRHLYAKGHAFEDGPFFPSLGERSPLETLYYETSGPFRVSTLPSSRLRYCHIWQRHIDRHTAELVNKCGNLRVLELWGDTWGPAVLISSSTLTHLHLHAQQVLPLNGQLAQGLPNLLHLRIQVDRAQSESPIHAPSWTPLPSLRSLSIEFGTASHQRVSYGSHLIHILRGAPRLVALQIDEIDAPEVIEFIRTHKEEELSDGARRRPVRLLLLMVDFQQAETRWGDLPNIASLLFSQDCIAQTEWRLQRCINPIKLGDFEVRQQVYGAASSCPLSVTADRFAD